MTGGTRSRSPAFGAGSAALALILQAVTLPRVAPGAVSGLRALGFDAAPRRRLGWPAWAPADLQRPLRRIHLDPPGGRGHLRDRRERPRHSAPGVRDCHRARHRARRPTGRPKPAPDRVPVPGSSGNRDARDAVQRRLDRRAVHRRRLWGFGFGGVPTAVLTWGAKTGPIRLEQIGGLIVTGCNIAIAVGAIVGGMLVDGISARGTQVGDRHHVPSPIWEALSPRGADRLRWGTSALIRTTREGRRPSRPGG